MHLVHDDSLTLGTWNENMLSPLDYQLLDKIMTILASGDAEVISVLRVDVEIFHQRLRPVSREADERDLYSSQSHG